MLKLRKWFIYGTCFIFFELLPPSQIRNPSQHAIPARTNYEYVLGVAEKNDALCSLLIKGKEGLAEDISRKLEELDHVNPEGYCDNPFYDDITLMNIPTPEELARFDEVRLIRIFYLLQALSDSDFRQRIGEELEKDTRDYTCEHGGVFHLKTNGSLDIEMLRNTQNDPNVDLIIINYAHYIPDKNYCPETPKYTLDILTGFHFHARQENFVESSALSHNDFLMEQAVFTRLGKNKFNADIGLFYKENDKVHKANLDLGVYGY